MTPAPETPFSHKARLERFSIFFKTHHVKRQEKSQTARKSGKRSLCEKGVKLTTATQAETITGRQTNRQTDKVNTEQSTRLHSTDLTSTFGRDTIPEGDGEAAPERTANNLVSLVTFKLTASSVRKVPR